MTAFIQFSVAIALIFAVGCTENKKKTTVLPAASTKLPDNVQTKKTDPKKKAESEKETPAENLNSQKTNPTPAKTDENSNKGKKGEGEDGPDTDGLGEAGAGAEAQGKVIGKGEQKQVTSPDRKRTTSPEHIARLKQLLAVLKAADHYFIETTLKHFKLEDKANLGASSLKEIGWFLSRHLQQKGADAELTAVVDQCEKDRSRKSRIKTVTSGEDKEWNLFVSPCSEGNEELAATITFSGLNVMKLHFINSVLASTSKPGIQFTANAAKCIFTYKPEVYGIETLLAMECGTYLECKDEQGGAAPAYEGLAITIPQTKDHPSANAMFEYLNQKYKEEGQKSRVVSHWACVHRIQKSQEKLTTEKSWISEKGEFLVVESTRARDKEIALRKKQEEMEKARQEGEEKVRAQAKAITDQENQRKLEEHKKAMAARGEAQTEEPEPKAGTGGVESSETNAPDEKSEQSSKATPTSNPAAPQPTTATPETTGAKESTATVDTVD